MIGSVPFLQPLIVFYVSPKFSKVQILVVSQ